MTKRLFEEYKESIPKVRKSTGAPTLHCIKALYQSDGDVDRAIDWIKINPCDYYV